MPSTGDFRLHFRPMPGAADQRYSTVLEWQTNAGANSIELGDFQRASIEDRVLDAFRRDPLSDRESLRKRLIAAFTAEATSKLRSCLGSARVRLRLVAHGTAEERERIMSLPFELLLHEGDDHKGMRPPAPWHPGWKLLRSVKSSATARPLPEEYAIAILRGAPFYEGGRQIAQADFETHLRRSQDFVRTLSSSGAPCSLKLAAPTIALVDSEDSPRGKPAKLPSSTILHYFGHIASDSNTTQRAFVLQGSKRVSAADLLTWLPEEPADRPRLAILSGCISWTLAEELIQGGIDAVVATLGEPRSSQEAEWCHAFYEELEKELSLLEALEIAEQKSKTYGLHALFAREGDLWPVLSWTELERISYRNWLREKTQPASGTAKNGCEPPPFRLEALVPKSGA